MVHALTLHENWNSPTTTPKQCISFQAHKINKSSENGLKPEGPAVRQVLFLPGHDGELLITLGESTITCWEVPLGASQAFVVATFTHEHKIEQVMVNEEPQKNGAVLAMSVLVDAE